MCLQGFLLLQPANRVGGSVCLHVCVCVCKKCVCIGQLTNGMCVCVLVCESGCVCIGNLQMVCVCVYACLFCACLWREVASVLAKFFFAAYSQCVCVPQSPFLLLGIDVCDVHLFFVIYLLRDSIDHVLERAICVRVYMYIHIYMGDENALTDVYMFIHMFVYIHTHRHTFMSRGRHL